MPSITCLFAVKSSLFITFQKFPVFATGFSAGPIPAKHPPVFPLPPVGWRNHPDSVFRPEGHIPPPLSRAPVSHHSSGADTVPTSQPRRCAPAIPRPPCPSRLSGAAPFRRSPPPCRFFPPGSSFRPAVSYAQLVQPLALPRRSTLLPTPSSLPRVPPPEPRQSIPAPWTLPVRQIRDVLRGAENGSG